MPSDANEKDGPCCVYGQTTTQRCGACQGAGFDLFFCSREHQKLVWFAHKRVCGKNPFTFPRLAADECTRANALANEPTMPSNVSDGSMSLSDAIWRYLDSKSVNIARLLKRYGVQQPCWPPVAIPVSDLTLDMLEPFCVVSSFTLGLLQTFFSNKEKKGIPFPFHTAFYNALLHHTLIYSAIRCRHC
ncbi:hypothetical protein JCM8547_005764 [Rhodosporidiobolus lusitaniae]